MSYVRGEDTPDTDASVSDGLVKFVYLLFKNIQTSNLGVWLFYHTFVDVKNLIFGVFRKYC